MTYTHSLFARCGGAPLPREMRSHVLPAIREAADVFADCQTDLFISNEVFFERELHLGKAERNQKNNHHSAAVSRLIQFWETYIPDPAETPTVARPTETPASAAEAARLTRNARRRAAYARRRDAERASMADTLAAENQPREAHTGWANANDDDPDETFDDLSITYADDYYDDPYDP